MSRSMALEDVSRCSGALEDVPLGWSRIALGRLGRFSKGRGGTKSDNQDEGVPCVRYGELYTKHEFFVRRATSFVSEDAARGYTPIAVGDTLFAGSGETLDEIGKSAVNLLESPVVCGGDIILFHPDSSIDHRFLGYATNSVQAQNQKSAMGRGMTVMHIYSSGLKCLEILVPPLLEQRAIADFLDRKTAAIDDLIRAKERLIALLKEKRQGLITQAVSPQAGAHDGPLVKLGHYVEILQGFAFPSSGFSADSEDVRLLRGVNVTPSGLRWDEVVHWPKSELQLYSRYLLRETDIVFGMDRPWISSGIRAAKIGSEDVPSLLLQRVARIRAKAGLRQEFVLLLLHSQEFQAYFEPIMTGVSVPHVSPSQIGNFRFRLPPLAEQDHRLDVFRRTSAAADQLRQEVVGSVHALQEYREALISSAVTGQLDVTSEPTSLA